MAGKNLRVVPKIIGNKIGIFVTSPSTGETIQVGLITCPDDNQLSDSVELANELCRAYGKRLRKSI